MKKSAMLLVSSPDLVASSDRLSVSRDLVLKRLQVHILNDEAEILGSFW